MTTVTLGVASREAFSGRVAAAMNGETQGRFIGFATPELLFETLTELRWKILRTITGAGPLSIGEIARRVDRDIEQVHTDVSALSNAGILDCIEDGSIVFPYDAIHVDFTFPPQPKTFAQALMSIPNVGEDADFERLARKI